MVKIISCDEDEAPFLSDRKIYDESEHVLGVKCQHCEFDQNPVDSHYCGRCGRNIAANNHIWEVYDSTSYSTYSKYGNRIISENKYQEYEKAVKAPFKYKLMSMWMHDKVEVMFLILGILIMVAVLINWIVMFIKKG